MRERRTDIVTDLDHFHPDSELWVKGTPAGWARRTTQGRWLPSRHLMFIQKHLVALDTGEIENLIITLPPRHGKSEFVTKAFPGWWLGNHPHDEVIIMSYEAGLATGFGGAIRDAIDEFGREVFGLGIRSNKRAASDWRLEGLDSEGKKATGGLRATGVGGGIVGRGGDLIIIDDPIKNARHAQSEVERKALWESYLADLYTRKSPTARQVLVTTRWHEDDLVGRLLEGRDDTEGQRWTVLNLAAICDSEDDPLRRELGEPLWGERWSLERLLEIKATYKNNPYWWGAMFQGRPAPASGNIFKRGWWRFWQPPGADLGPVRVRAGDDEEVVRKPIDLPPLELVASSWDLAVKKGPNTSYVAGQKWGRAGGRAFLLDQTRDRRDFPETVREFRQFHELHDDIEPKWVEDKANGPALIALLTDEISGIIPVEPKGTKEDRARAVAYYCEARNVYLPHPAIAPWVWEYIEEHAAFPNAMWNDQVDTTSQALKKLFGEDHEPSMLWGSRHRLTA